MSQQATLASRQALARAKLFLEKAKNARAEERVDFEAFVEASIVFARATLHRMKTRYGRRAGWSDWWESLRGDPAIEFFRTERDWILKESSARVGQKVYLHAAGSKDPPSFPRMAQEYYYFKDPATSATSTLEKHLLELERRVDEAEVRFASAD
jgi:hypothetical protein